MTCSQRMGRRKTWQKAESGFCISHLQPISIAPRVCWRVLVYSHVAFANGKRKIDTASRSSPASASRLSRGILFVWFMSHGGSHTALEASSPLRTLHIHNHEIVHTAVKAYAVAAKLDLGASWRQPYCCGRLCCHLEACAVRCQAASHTIERVPSSLRSLHHNEL